MTRQRLWVILGTVVIAGVLALGWFLAISPRLADASTAAQAELDAEANNALLEQQLLVLQQDYEGIDDLREELDAISESLPPSTSLASLIGQLQAVQETTGAPFTSIVFGTPSEYIAPTTADVAPVEGTDSGTDSAETPDSTVPADPGAGMAFVPPDDVAAVSNGRLVLIPVTLTVSGGVDGTFATASALRGIPRLFLVTGVSVGEGDGTASGIISGFVFVLIDPFSTAAPSSSPSSTPTPTPTPTESATPTPTGSPTP